MARATAALAREQAIVIAASQSCKIINDGSKVANGVSQIASHALKKKI